MSDVTNRLSAALDATSDVEHRAAIADAIEQLNRREIEDAELNEALAKCYGRAEAVNIRGKIVFARNTIGVSQ